MQKQTILEKENQKLRDEVRYLKENELKTSEYENTIKNLSDRLEKLLKE